MPIGERRAAVPGRVEGLPPIRAIAMGDDSCLALDGAGLIWAWGLDSDGELGDGETQDKYAPVRGADLGRVAAIGAGGKVSRAVLEDGAVWVWGIHPVDRGTLGDGATLPMLARRTAAPGR